jgi:2-dehydro-3-deoxyphosphooctonate aldolase (KDO 8-P synthase)
MRRIPVKDFFIGENEPLIIISGPCVIESEEHCLRSAEALVEIFAAAGVRLIFKSSYDKANRSAHTSFRGIGMHEGLKILERVKKEFDVPLLTDVHEVDQAAPVAQVCDILQIPALLCRQTDLLVAVAETGAVVNIKKGQFMAPWDMGNALEKVRQAGNENVFLTERGTTFGYNNLVCDMRAIPIMTGFGVPVCFDATHAVQLPGGNGEYSGGQREFIAPLAKAAIAAGANCLYMESHPNPAHAKSDKDSVIDFKDLPALLKQLKQLYELVRAWSNPHGN